MKTGGARRLGGRVEARRGEPDRYAFLLLMIAISVILTAGSGTVARVASVVLQGAVVLFALHTAKASRRTFRAALVLVPSTVLIGAIGHISDSDAAEVLAGVIMTALPLVTIVVIGRRLVTHPEVTVQSVLGFISIYLLFGILFAALYATLDVRTDASFFAQTDSPTRVDFLYFSYITMTTVGYGDLTPVEPLPRMLAATEALIGQLYLVTVVAVAVTRVRRRNRDES